MYYKCVTNVGIVECKKYDYDISPSAMVRWKNNKVT